MPLRIEHRLRRPLGPEMKAERVFQLALHEELEDALAVLVLTIQIVGGLVFQFGGDDLLAVVVPIGVDADEQVAFRPVDGVVVDEPFAGVGDVEPVADETVFQTVDVALSAPVINLAWAVRMAWPLSGLATQIFLSLQSYRPTWGYLPLNLSVQSFVLTRAPGEFGGVLSRLVKRNIPKRDDTKDEPQMHADESVIPCICG